MDMSTVLEIVTRSDPGMVRSNNEDSVTANATVGFAVLADGMGGYNAGEVASGMATTMLGSELANAFAERSPSSVVEGGKSWAEVTLAMQMGLVNSAIYQSSQTNPQHAGMGTTLVVAVFHDNKVTVGHIGDSRMYRLRGEDFQQITRDHSLLQEQIDAGLITPEQARHSQNKNLVTRAVGIDPEVAAEIHDHEVMPGDVYLLCSDGLNDMVEDDEISMTLGALSANLELCATQLIQMANDNGGRDNVSVILVKVKGDFPESRGMLARLLAWFK